MSSEITIKKAVELGKYGSESTIRRRVRDGSVRARKVKNRLLLAVEDLEAIEAAIDDDAAYERFRRNLLETFPALTPERRERLRTLLTLVG